MHERITADLQAPPKDVEPIGGLVRLYHNASPEDVASIAEVGIVPGGLKGEVYCGIANAIADRLAPSAYKRQGVLRQNVVFAWLNPEDSTKKSPKLVTTMIDVEPERVYVGDLSSSGYLSSRSWELVYPAYSHSLSYLDDSNWSPEKQDAYAELFDRHFFDADFNERIAAFHPEASLDTMDALGKALIESKKAVWEKARPVAREYWRRVVPLKTFQDNYHLDSRTQMWVPDIEGLVRIAEPEAMVPGVIPKERVHTS